MSNAARFTWLVLGAVAVTLVLAAAISATMDSGNALPALAHTVAIRTTGGGEPQPGDDRGQDGVTVPPATIVPAPQPTADVEENEPEPEPADDQDRDRGDVATTSVAEASHNPATTADRTASRR